jgi:uncharacterized protein YukE
MSGDDQVTYSVGGYRNAPGVSPTPAGPTPSQPEPFSTPPGSVTVNTDDLQQAAGQFSTLSEQITQMYQSVVQTLNGNDEGGAPWGTDSLGQSFAEQYVPASQTTLQALHGLSQLFSAISSSLGQTAQTYLQADDNNNGIAYKIV